MTSHHFLLDVLAKPKSSPAIATVLSRIAEEQVVLTQKDFKTVSYESSQSHGISFQFEQDENTSNWTCKAVDIYNKDAVKGWSSFPRLPITLTLTEQSDDKNKVAFHLDGDTTGVELVKQLGEPDRKGGGEPMKGGGASGLGPGAWMEWNVLYKDQLISVMIELAGQAARGRDRWEKERAGVAQWGICTFALVD